MGYGDTSGQGVRTDPDSRGVVAVPPFGAALHRGEVYKLSRLNESVGADDSIEVLLIVPAGLKPHLRVFLFGSQQANVYLYEGTTVEPAGEGTPITLRNANRNHADESQVLAYFGPTIDEEGDELVEQFMPGGQAGNATGDETRLFEFVLRADTTYMMRFTSKGTGNSSFGLKAVLWEHPGI